MGCPNQPGWYVAKRDQLRDQIREAKRNYDRSAGANTNHLRRASAFNAIYLVITSAAVVVAGPIGLLGMTMPFLLKMAEEAQDGGVEYTYQTAMQLVDRIDVSIRNLKNASVLDRRWDEVCASIAATEVFIKALQKAAAAR